MPLRAEWIDSLFGRLAVRYGTSFGRQYEGLDIAAVKADWAEVLDGVAADSIAYALRYLPTERPPNAGQFRDLCRRAPTQDRQAIAPPAGDPPDPQMVRAVVAKIGQRRGSMSLAQQCVENIRRVVEERGYMSIAQREQIKAIERAGLLFKPASSEDVA